MDDHKCMNGLVLLDVSTDRWGVCPSCAVKDVDVDKEFRLEQEANRAAVEAMAKMGKRAPRGDRRDELLGVFADIYKQGARRKP